MKQLFTIKPASGQSTDLLICELSHYHIGLAGADASGQIAWLQYYEKATPLTSADVSSLLQHEPVASKRFNSLLIGSAFPDATLVPGRLATEKGLHTFLKNAPDQNIFVDEVPVQNLQVVYSVPAAFYNLLQQEFTVHSMHVHTAAIKMLDTAAANYMALHFTPKEFRVLAVKNGEVQLAQIYPFTTPLDVVYYLLMISAQYNMPQSETVVELSGLVDESSALFKELYQYYTQVQLSGAASVALPENNYQPHFFSSLYNLAACASSVAS